jgi:thiamine biosynthesis protein ThiI
MENFVKLTNHLKKIIPGKIKIVISHHGENLSIYKQYCNNRLTCVFCKRMLLRYAEKIAEKYNAHAIIMGDSLGQVASQTLQNIKVIDQAVKTPVLRPLIGMDKEDVVKIAKEIGTYELSILHSDKCSAVPNKPATMTKLEKILEEERKLKVEKLVNKALDDVEDIKM